MQVVRTINALEQAKRSMDMAHISAYQKERELVSSIIRSKYPTPIVMVATASYLKDNSKKLELAEGLSELLGLAVEEILAQMEEILKGSEEVTTGFYSIQYVDVDTEEVLFNLPQEADFGTVEVVPVSPSEKYELVDVEPVSFELNKDTNGKVFSFYVKAVESSEEVEATTGSYTVSYVTDMQELIHHETFDNVEFGEHLVEAKLPEGYELVDSAETSKMINMTKEDSEQELTFYVKEIEQVTTEDSATVSPLARSNSPLVASFMVASINDLYLSSSEVAATKVDTGVTHQQYLYQAAYALVMTEAYVSNPTDQNLVSAKSYIEENLLKGSYKAELLGLLNATAEEIANNSKPELTPVYPYVPPVKPVDPPEVIPPDNGGDNGSGGGGYVPPTGEVKPPVVIEPPTDGTTAEAEKVHDVVVKEDGSLSWVIDKPLKGEFDLNGPDINIKVSFDKDLVDKAKKFEILWES